MSYPPRVARLAARVSQARRPKRSQAAAGASWDSSAERQLPQVQRLAPAPEVPPAVKDAPPAPALPFSEEAVRWLTQGAVPATLVPLLGDPEFPDADTGIAPAPQEAAAPRVQPPSSAPGEDAAFTALARASEAPGQSFDQAPARVITRVTEGAIHELAPVSRASQPLLRLARQPQHSTTTLAPASASASAASADMAVELARLPGAELTSDGAARSTVTFPAAGGGGAAPAPSTAGAAAGSGSRPSPAASLDAGCPAETPLTGAVAQRLGELDLDAIYDGFIERLRRDLLHDRERLGDLLGPIR